MDIRIMYKDCSKIIASYSNIERNYGGFIPQIGSLICFKNGDKNVVKKVISVIFNYTFGHIDVIIK